MSISRALLFAPFGLISLISTQSLRAATIEPNIFSDPALVGAHSSTDYSLRYAIQSINDGTNFEGGCQAFSTGTLGDNDAIALVAGTYLLSLSGAEEDGNQSGDLDIRRDVAIQGAGVDATIVDASGIDGGDRVFHAYYLADETTLAGMTITGGDLSNTDSFSGGGILGASNRLTLDTVRVAGNTGLSGGGVAVYPVEEGVHLLVHNSTIEGNTALKGGGLYVSDSLVGISNSTIAGNAATAGGGGGIFQVGNDLFLTNSTISGNTSMADGGGILTAFDGLGSGGIKGAYNVTIAFNHALGDGGGIAGAFMLQPQ